MFMDTINYSLCYLAGNRFIRDVGSHHEIIPRSKEYDDPQAFIDGAKDAIAALDGRHRN